MKTASRRFKLRVEDLKAWSLENITNNRIKQSQEFIRQSKELLDDLEHNAEQNDFSYPPKIDELK